MAIDFGINITNFLLQLHDFIDWTSRWGQPRTAREETAFYDLRGKIGQEEVKLKPFVHKLRLTLETFLEDYKNEPNAKERIGNDFKQHAAELLEGMNHVKSSLNDEDKSLCEEIEKITKIVINHIK